MEISFTNEDLSRLNQLEAVELVRDLVQADADESGIPLNTISIPSSTNAPDGGIDGRVDTADKNSNQGTIKKGLTCYQIKSGDYRIDQLGIKELFGAKDNLKPEVKNCLKNGTLIIVLTGQDLPIEGEKKKIYEYLGWKPAIEIWAQSTLIGYLKHYPKLCLQILKIQDGSFCYYDDWAGQEDMHYDLVLGKAQDDFISSLGQQLLSETSAEHIRVTGAHGIGKTRLVLEALRPTELSRLCIYVCNPNKFIKSSFFKYLTVRGDRVRAILVVDECSEEYMEDIWLQINKHGNRIKMITLYDRKPRLGRHGMKILEVPPLEDEHIKRILESYVGPQYQAGIWYAECKSSPRAAHIIGENLSSNPDDILRQPGASGWNRYIAYRSSIIDEVFARRKAVLLWIGRLRWFGYGSTYAGERKIMEDKIKDQEGIEKGVFAKTVKELVDMGILLGSNILHIEPNALHAWLWREWYEEYGELEPFPLDAMWEMAKSDDAYKNVLEWHVDMWQYDEEDSPHHAVKDVFSHDGFADRQSLLDSYFGADVLYKMSKASPRDAVKYLEHYVEALGIAGLQQFRVGRRQAAMILVDAAGCSSLFKRAAQVLLLLAGTGHQEDDDADNMFARLFLPAAGPVGWTETPLAKRVPLLKEALASEITSCRLVGIKACEAALRTRHFIKDIVDDEAWQRGMIWMPKDRMEYVEYYHEVLDAVRARLKYLNEEERSHLAKVVLSRTRDLLKAPELHNTILVLLREMHDEQYTDSEIIIETISDCLAYGRDNMPKDLRHRLSQLHDGIVGDSYHGSMRRHVAMNVFSDFQIPNDIRQETITNLAKRSFNDSQALNQELVWLVTDEATHGYEFGYALGKMDDGSLFASIRDAQRRCVKSNAAFLGGYLRAVFDRDRNEWERLMCSLAADPVLYERMPVLTSMSGMTDKISIRILELVKSGVDPLTLRGFTFGTFVCNVPEVVFRKWLGLLVNESAEAYEVVLNLCHRYYVHSKRRIPDSVSVLLFPRNDSHRIRHGSGQAVFFWSEILDSYIRQGPVTADVVSNVVDVVITGDAYSMHDMELMSALAPVMEHHPSKTWKAISTLLDPDKNPSVHTRLNVKRAFSINRILVKKITLATIYEWVDEDVERRAAMVAGLLPYDIEVAAEYAAKYGEIDRVKKVLIANLQLESFSGPRLEYYRDKIKTVDSLIAGEDHPIIREFLEDYRAVLSEQCDSA